MLLLKVLLVSSYITTTVAFGWSPSALLTRCRSNSQAIKKPTEPSTPRTSISSSSALWGGIGIAEDYSWRELQYEIEITVKVPPKTRGKDILFDAKADSLDLRLVNTGQILLHGNRTLRGRLRVDGTYWSIADDDDDDADTAAVVGDERRRRKVMVTLEKWIRPPVDEFDVVDYDWGGVYQCDDHEVSHRQYDQPEELNVREYAQSLGVNVDHMNMSQVDKNMFGGLMGSELNLTKQSLDELVKSGLVQEVTQQGDGSEFTVNDEGDVVPHSTMGSSIGKDEMENAGILPNQSKKKRRPTFLDKSSPWKQSLAVEHLNETDSLYPNNNNNNTTSSSSKDEEEDEEEETVTKKRRLQTTMKDPIDILTVKRLKEILKKEHLKVSGTKAELQARLRDHIQSVMIHKQQQQQQQQQNMDQASNNGVSP